MFKIITVKVRCVTKACQHCVDEVIINSCCIFSIVNFGAEMKGCQVRDKIAGERYMRNFTIIIRHTCKGKLINI